MYYQKRIELNPKVMLGKPVIKGTRVTVESIIRDMSDGATIEDILIASPHLQKEDILAALSYCANDIANEEIIFVS